MRTPGGERDRAGERGDDTVSGLSRSVGRAGRGNNEDQAPRKAGLACGDQAAVCGALRRRHRPQGLGVGRHPPVAPASERAPGGRTHPRPRGHVRPGDDRAPRPTPRAGRGLGGPGVGRGAVSPNTRAPALAGLQSWIEAGGRLRRAAVLAVRALVLDGTLSASASLRALDAVIDDPDSYVQASVGGFLAGDALFRRYPRETAAYLAERVRAGAVNPVFWKNVRDALRSNGARAGWTLIRDHLAAWTAAPVPAAVRRELDRLSEKEDVHA